MKDFTRLLTEMSVELKLEKVPHPSRSSEGRACKIRNLAKLLKHRNDTVQKDSTHTPDKVKKVKSGMTKDVPDGPRESVTDMFSRLVERVATAQGRPKGMPRHEWEKKNPEAHKAAETAATGGGHPEGGVEVPGQKEKQAHAFGHGSQSEPQEKPTKETPPPLPKQKETPPPLPKQKDKEAPEDGDTKKPGDFSVLKRFLGGKYSGFTAPGQTAYPHGETKYAETGRPGSGDTDRPDHVDATGSTDTTPNPKSKDRPSTTPEIAGRSKGNDTEKETAPDDTEKTGWSAGIKHGGILNRAKRAATKVTGSGSSGGSARPR